MTAPPCDFCRRRPVYGPDYLERGSLGRAACEPCYWYVTTAPARVRLRLVGIALSQRRARESEVRMARARRMLSASRVAFDCEFIDCRFVAP